MCLSLKPIEVYEAAHMDGESSPDSHLVFGERISGQIIHIIVSLIGSALFLVSKDLIKEQIKAVL